jgi:hypothetical protein
VVVTLRLYDVFKDRPKLQTQKQKPAAADSELETMDENEPAEENKTPV